MPQRGFAVVSGFAQARAARSIFFSFCKIIKTKKQRQMEMENYSGIKAAVEGIFADAADFAKGK